MLSKETLSFVQNIINGITLNVGAPDIEEVADTVLKARREIAAELELASVEEV